MYDFLHHTIQLAHDMTLWHDLFRGEMLHHYIHPYTTYNQATPASTVGQN